MTESALIISRNLIFAFACLFFSPDDATSEVVKITDEDCAAVGDLLHSYGDTVQAFLYAMDKISTILSSHAVGVSQMEVDEIKSAIGGTEEKMLISTDLVKRTSNFAKACGF